MSLKKKKALDISTFEIGGEGSVSVDRARTPRLTKYSSVSKPSKILMKLEIWFEFYG